MTPSFARELDTTLPVCSHFLLHGNVRDQYLAEVDGEVRPLEMPELLWHTLEPAGFAFLLLYDPVAGLRVHPPSPEARDAAKSTLGKLIEARPHSLERLGELIARMSRPESEGARAALVVGDASRLAIRPESLEREEHRFFTAAAGRAREAKAVWIPGQTRKAALFNPVIWLLDREPDFPSWYSADNERVRSIAVPLPDLGHRLALAEILADSFPEHPEADPAEARRAFASQSEGLSLDAMLAATRLARDRGLHVGQLPEAVRTYRLGVIDNPWGRAHLREQITEGAAGLHDRVIGQHAAVTKTLDILKRSVVGLSGAHASASATRPRGTLFFAGPTGVGKTELAKAIARLVFGDESAYLRFDMSEFAAEHAGDRLIGAPPGYVGFEAGGELTNAMRLRPFRVVLFDEIEKAHPLILDKFLQVLDEGRLSDGRGNTAHFSEAILVFTSNLGAADLPHDPERPYEETARVIRERVSAYFVDRLRRPELLNRFGDNIVVFDHIGPEAAARIFDAQLERVLDLARLRTGATVTLEPAAREQLRDWCTSDLRNGGRGIGSGLETHLVNPLSRALFDDPALTGPLTVTALDREGGTTSARFR